MNVLKRHWWRILMALWAAFCAIATFSILGYQWATDVFDVITWGFRGVGLVALTTFAIIWLRGKLRTRSGGESR